ncbi:hypothetical protein MKW94_022930 [Papaver nudicaule]|uniref:Sodium/calcium exchanger membrane region domain-containing protein n=1 Tax=Papaver nudicaule TaxID=74823 RepID=A0AA41SH61_PAPNU|nr:hypothetical protein [Papaver nudicaule]
MARVNSSLTQVRKPFILFVNISFLFLLSFYCTILLFSSNSHLLHQSKRSTNRVQKLDGTVNCSQVHHFHTYQEKCEYVKSTKGCRSDGYIDYLQIFYCICGSSPGLGYTVLILWLILLFYLLANTAANYFCSSLESLSKILQLSPTIAGVTLLSLGNGAPDVFASLASFMGTTGSGGVGLNSVLGGAFFVSSVVVGVISISISSKGVSVDKSSFIRDVLFFLLTLGSLLAIVIVGAINIWGAIAFVSLYFIYVFIVSAAHICRKKDIKVSNIFDISPITRTLFAYDPNEQFGDFSTPLLGYVNDDVEKLGSIEKCGVNNDTEDEDREDNPQNGNCFGLFDSTVWGYFSWFLYIIELPIYLPRRMTIPVVSEERWSKFFGVISVTLAPVLLVALWVSQNKTIGYNRSLVVYLAGGLVGIVFGTVAFVTTKSANPPKRCLLPWLVGGFLMSVAWTYIIANELVSLLVSLGNIFGISPSILGLTLLAWGNSIGDLVANVAMAVNGDQDGAQIAISGSYAGPIFNTIMGLGLGFVFKTWTEYPSSFVIPKDNSMYVTIGFLMAGLLWALVILPRRNMKLDKVLGCGLVAIYFCFLSLRLAQTLGGVPIQGPLTAIFLEP